MKSRFGRRVDFRTDIAARHRIDAVLHHPPFDQRFDIGLVEGSKTVFRKRRGRAQLAGTERRQRSAGRLDNLRDLFKTLLQWHNIREAYALDAEAGKSRNAARILADARHEPVAAISRLDGLDHGCLLDFAVKLFASLNPRYE